MVCGTKAAHPFADVWGRKLMAISPITSIVGLLEHWASAQPGKVLFEFRDWRGLTTERHTYQSFQERTQSLAVHLMETPGLCPGDRVLLAYPPGLGSITGLLACARAGLIGVPVALPKASDDVVTRRLQSIGEDCQAKALLSNGPHSSRLGLHTMSNGARHSWRPLNTDDFAAAPLSSAQHRHQEVLLLQYTSGTTGRPRGVMVSHSNVIANAKATLDHTPIGVSWLPQHHDMGMIGYYLFPIVVGGTSFGFAPADFLRKPALWIRTLSEVGATYTSSPNFGYEYCLRDGKIGEADLDGVDLSSVQVLMNASEPARPETVDRFHRRFARYGLRRTACTVAYGLAENTLNVAHGGRGAIAVSRSALYEGRVEVREDTEGRDSVKIASCGRPAPGVTVYVRDAATGLCLEELSPGEICVGGASATRGYWNNEEATSNLFCQISKGESTSEDLLRTGDLGFFYAGELYVCGRIKDLIIVGGAKFLPDDLEAAIRESGAEVRSRGICAFQTEDGQVVILVEPIRAVDAHDPERLANVVGKICGLAPDILHIVSPGTISITTSGKVARADTRAQYATGVVRVLATYRRRAQTERSPVDASIDWRGAVRQIFSRHGATRDDVPIGTLGIDSLALTELQLELEEVLRHVGSGALAEALDASLLQRVSLRDLLSTLAPLDSTSDEGANAALAALAKRRSSINDAISAQMLEDRHRAVGLCRPLSVPATSFGDSILLTGATGFFGPFLLDELLRQSDAPVLVLVRAQNAETAMERVEIALTNARVLTPRLRDVLSARVRPVCGDLSLPRWGLTLEQWSRLARSVREVFHNGACVNYVMTYEAMRRANVGGTLTALQLALDSNARALHLISSTFIFGWTAKKVLLETEFNADMQALDFGYAQSKWVAEQQALRARADGLDVRVFRPSLISVSRQGAGDLNDVAIRMLAFMIRHGIAVDTPNQLSIVAADVIAHNIVGISRLDGVRSAAFHVTADHYYSITELTKVISRDYGYAFTYYDIPHFIHELNRRCSPRDPVYPLLDFFNRSADKIATMQLKRYSSIAYQEARARLRDPTPDPSLAQMVSYLMRYLLEQGFIEPLSADMQHS